MPRRARAYATGALSISSGCVLRARSTREPGRRARAVHACPTAVARSSRSSRRAALARDGARGVFRSHDARSTFAMRDPSAGAVWRGALGARAHTGVHDLPPTGPVPGGAAPVQRRGGRAVLRARGRRGRRERLRGPRVGRAPPLLCRDERAVPSDDLRRPRERLPRRALRHPQRARRVPPRDADLPGERDVILSRVTIRLAKRLRPRVRSRS
jgi:hypothetical protein